MPNIAWGIPEYNTFGTDEFLEFCKLVNAEPQVALNLGTGTPQEAGEWVRYVNQRWKDGKGGLLWELGNELWGNWNTGWPALEQLAPRTKEFSEAIRMVDPQARLIATGQDPDAYQKWNAAQTPQSSWHSELSLDSLCSDHGSRRPEKPVSRVSCGGVLCNAPQNWNED